MNTQARTLRESTRVVEPPPAARPRPGDGQRPGEAARRALARWFGDGADAAVVRGDK